MEVISESYDSSISVECLLTPGDVLLNCDGQDIAKKGSGKGRYRVLTILPAQFVIGSKIADCTLGNLRKFNSEAPEFVVEVDGGALVFPGKFEIPSTKFLSILCQPSSSKKTGQSSLTDVFERVLVFGKPTLVPSTSLHNGQPISQGLVRASTEDSFQCSQDSNASASLNNTSTPATQLTARHGVSSLADPIKPGTAKRLLSASNHSCTDSRIKTARVKSAVVGRLGPSSPSKSSGTKRSKQVVRSAAESDSEEGGGESDGDEEGSTGSNSSSSGLSIADSASDAEEEFGGCGVGDSPVVDRRSSSRRASASKPVNYRVDDIHESDDDDESSSSGSSSGLSDNIVDISSDEEATGVKLDSKSPLKRVNSTGSSASKELKPAKATPRARKNPTSPAAAKSSTFSSASKKAASTKIPVARKLADSTKKRKSSRGAKNAYFSDSGDGSSGDGERGSGKSQSDGDGGSDDSSRLGGDSTEESEDSDYSESSSKRKAKKPKLSQPQSQSSSPRSKKSDTASAAQKKGGASAKKVVQSKSGIPRAKSEPSSKPSSSSSKGASAAPKSETSTSASARKSGSAKKKAAPVSAKRKAAAMDSDVEVISINDNSDSDEDYFE